MIVFLIDVTCLSIDEILVSSNSEILCSRELILSSSLPHETKTIVIIVASIDNSTMLFIVLNLWFLLSGTPADIFYTKKVWSRRLYLQGGSGKPKYG